PENVAPGRTAGRANRLCATEAISQVMMIAAIPKVVACTARRYSRNSGLFLGFLGDNFWKPVLLTKASRRRRVCQFDAGKSASSCPVPSLVPSASRRGGERQPAVLQ